MQKSDLIIGNEYAANDGSCKLKLIAIDNNGNAILIDCAGRKGWGFLSRENAERLGFADAWVPGCFGIYIDSFLKKCKPSKK